MARDLQRTKPDIDSLDSHPGGLDEFAPRERITKEVSEPFVQPGWSSDRKPPRTQAAKLPVFKVPDDGEEVLIKFTDDRPFAPIFQHWVLIEGGQRRAYTCLGKECPLCERGDKAKSSDWFNVVVLGDEPELKIWYATSDPAAAIKERADAKRTSPISKPGQYFAVSKRKASNGFNTYSIDVVKEDELEADWGVKPLTESAIENFKNNAYNGDLVKVMTRTELSEIARKYLSDD